LEDPTGDLLSAGHAPARNTLYSLVQQALSAAFTAALTLFLVRALGPTDFGVLALATSIGTIVMLVSDFGISTSAARYVAEDSRSRSHAAAVLRSAFGLKLLTATITAAALIALAPTLASAFDTPSLTLPIRLVACATAAQGFGTLLITMFAAMGRVSLGFGYTFVESSVEAVTGSALVLLGAGAAGAIAGRAIGFAAAAILAGIVIVRLIGRPAIRRAKGHGFPRGKIVGYGFALLVIEGAFAIFDRVDVLIIGAILGSTAAGLFEAPIRLLALIKYPAIAIAIGFTPRLAGSERRLEEVDRFFAALRAVTLFYMLVAAVVLVWADPIVHLLLGSGYGESVAVLRASAPVVLFSGLSPILASAANYLGEARRRVPLALAALGLNIAIDLVLVPKIGIVAGAIGTGVALFVYTAGHVRICAKALDRSFRPLLPTVARGSAAGAAVALLLFALGTGSIGPLAWLVGIVAGPIVFVAVLLLTREASIGELRWVAGRGRDLLPFRRENAPGATK
jgi:O-antigen/teichoic acid export membrane protein